MNYQNRIHLRGDLEIEVFDAKTFSHAAFYERLLGRVRTQDVGARLYRHAVRNTITFGGIGAPLVLLAQNTGTNPLDYQLAKLCVGTNATPPTRGDTALGAPVSAGAGGVKVLADANRTVSLPAGELVIAVTFDAGDANVGPSQSLCEASVVLGNGTTFSRQVNPGIPKTSAIVAAYTWRFGLQA
jgi:hypothetical protein